MVFRGDLLGGIDKKYEFYLDGYVNVVDLVLGLNKIVDFEILVVVYFEKYLDVELFEDDIENLR